MSNKLIVEGEALRNGAYRFLKDGAVEFIDAKGVAKTVEPKAIKGPLEALLKEVKSAPGSLSQGARSWLESNLKNIDVAHSYPKGTPAQDAALKAVKEGMAGIQEALDFATVQNKTPDVAGIRAGILKHGKFAEELLSPATLEAVAEKGLKLSDMASLRADGEALKGLLKVEGANSIAIDKVKALLMKNHGSADELVAALGTSADGFLKANHGETLAEMASAIKGQVSAAETALRPAIEAVKSAAENLEHAKKEMAHLPESITSAEKALEEAKKASAKLLGKAEGQEAMKILSADEAFKETLDAARKVSPEIEKGAKGAAAQVANATKGAKWVTGGKWSSFTHSVETVGTDIGKLGKFRWGKAAIIGLPIAAIGAYFVAGTGNKGPGERAEAVNRGREQGQAAGIGA